MITVSAWWRSRPSPSEVIVLSLLKMLAHCLKGLLVARRGVGNDLQSLHHKVHQRLPIGEVDVVRMTLANFCLVKNSKLLK